jgi:hypothetical protein
MFRNNQLEMIQVFTSYTHLYKFEEDKVNYNILQFVIRYIICTNKKMCDIISNYLYQEHVKHNFMRFIITQRSLVQRYNKEGISVSN